MLEHPAHSAAWAAHDLAKPPREGEWVRADCIGWTCHVEQGHYGHRARKATWLYVVGASLPALRWGPSAAMARLDAGYHSAAERRAKAGRAYTGGRRLTPRENLATPPAFREALLSIARGAR